MKVPTLHCLVATHQHLVVLHDGSAGHFRRLAGRTAGTLQPARRHIELCLRTDSSSMSSPTHLVFKLTLSARAQTMHLLRRVT